MKFEASRDKFTPTLTLPHQGGGNNRNTLALGLGVLLPRVALPVGRMGTTLGLHWSTRAWLSLLKCSSADTEAGCKLTAKEKEQLGCEPVAVGRYASGDKVRAVVTGQRTVTPSFGSAELRGGGQSETERAGPVRACPLKTLVAY